MPNLKIYCLFADGGHDIPEHLFVPHVVWFNEHCATLPLEKLDGVAVNNEYFSKSMTEPEMLQILDYLNEIKIEDNQQAATGSLLTVTGEPS